MTNAATKMRQVRTVGPNEVRRRIKELKGTLETLKGREHYHYYKELLEINESILWAMSQEKR